jgi:hypothetical protein
MVNFQISSSLGRWMINKICKNDEKKKMNHGSTKVGYSFLENYCEKLWYLMINYGELKKWNSIH